MNKDKHNITPDEYTDAELDKFRPLAEVMPPEFVKMALAHTHQRVRGKQKAPVKSATTLRLDDKILTFFKKDGKGYQTRINQVLLDYVNANS